MPCVAVKNASAICRLAVLREAGVVTSEKRGTNIYYSLALRCLETFLACTGDLVRRRILEQLPLLEKK